MKKAEYELGDTLYYKDTGLLAGKVIGVRETYWSMDDFSSVTYVVSTPRGRVRRISGDEIAQLKKRWDCNSLLCSWAWRVGSHNWIRNSECRPSAEPLRTRWLPHRVCLCHCSLARGLHHPRDRLRALDSKRSFWICCKNIKRIRSWKFTTKRLKL